MDFLIEQMDIKSDPVTRTWSVLPLKHGDAKDVASLLTALISGQNAAAQKSQSNSVKPTTPGQPAAPVPATPASPSAVADSLASSEFSNFVTVQADERTNSVVVSGTVDDIRLIRGIVEKIDVLLAQVAIEVVIAEVTLSDSDQNGLSALNLTVGPAKNGGTSITGFNGSIAGSIAGAIGTSPGRPSTP